MPGTAATIAPQPAADQPQTPSSRPVEECSSRLVIDTLPEETGHPSKPRTDEPTGWSVEDAAPSDASQEMVDEKPGPEGMQGEPKSDESIGLSPEEIEPPVGGEPLPEVGTAELTAILDHEEALRQLEVLQVDLQRARRDASELKELALRKAADLENFRRRTQRQLDDMAQYGNEKVLKGFLPIVDDLERAIQHAGILDQPVSQLQEVHQRFTSFVDGTALVLRKFQQVLERFGVRGFDSIGQPFNPQFHEALSQVDSSTHAAGTIVAEYLRGYVLHDRLIRPALVIVAREPTPVEPVAVSSTEAPDSQEATADKEQETLAGPEAAAPQEPPDQSAEAAVEESGKEQ
ncbi:MAG: nucleotide exchange factor GrpE [Bradymonadales bacterium]|nr:nucleotide exchange factor GrpE [Bradymonadales bacterium]